MTGILQRMEDWFRVDNRDASIEFPFRWYRVIPGPYSHGWDLAMNLYELLSAWGDKRELLKRGGILSTNGRVLVAIIIDDTITQIAIAVLLGISQSAVEKAVSFWVDAGILTVEKRGRGNAYSVNWVKLKEHPDYPTLKAFSKGDD